MNREWGRSIQADTTLRGLLRRDSARTDRHFYGGDSRIGTAIGHMRKAADFIWITGLQSSCLGASPAASVPMIEDSGRTQRAESGKARRALVPACTGRAWSGSFP